jgi:hypothetical protein
MGVMLGPAIVPGNRVTDLENGDEIFPAMLVAIRGAQKTITFETYIYWEGQVGKDFADALSERARAGVAVNVTIDWAGSITMDEKQLQQMQDAGVHVERYRPLHWYNLGRLNNRTHRKLLVVDGRVGFTGGVGIGDPWRAMPRMPTTGAMSTSASRDRWSRSSSPPSTTTGSRPPARCSTAPTTSRPWKRPTGWTRTCSSVRRQAAAKACT